MAIIIFTTINIHTYIVVPTLSAVLISAPLDINTFTTSICPLSAASWRGVDLYCDAIRDYNIIIIQVNRSKNQASLTLEVDVIIK